MVSEGLCVLIGEKLGDLMHLQCSAVLEDLDVLQGECRESKAH